MDQLDGIEDRFGPFQPGSVSLVGAGPGDLGLLAIKAAVRLAQADVVLYDSLVNPEILRFASPSAQRIQCGKRGGQPGANQDDINEQLVQHAKAGKRVVRLKGGDPYVFGRGGEEAIVLREHGIAFEVVCGVTSGLAAGCYAGIPLTHRGFGSTLAMLTGHEDSAKPETQIDYAALAKLGTIVMYMGVRTLSENCRRLVEAGMAADTPVAVIRWGSRPDQQTVIGTLADIADRVADAGLTAPAITIVGQVVTLRETLNWFERLPLFGQRVVITRPVEQAGSLADRLAALGAGVSVAPAIEIHPLADTTAVDDAIGHLGDYDWLVLTSVNGVRCMFDRMDALGLDGRSLAGVRLACIGQTTADALAQRFLHADCVPEQYTSESLAAAMTACHTLDGAGVLLLRADIAGKELPSVLTDAGAVCDDLPIYRTVEPATLPVDVVEQFEAGAVDWVTFTSTSTVTNLLRLLGDRACDLLRDVKLASIGPVTTRTLTNAGLTPTVEAAPHTVPSLVEAMAAAVR